MRHDAVFEHRLRAHRPEYCLGRLCRGYGVLVAPFGECQQNLGPPPQRREVRRRGVERVEFAERGARLVRPTEGDQRLRPLQMPVARGGGIAGRWIDLVQQPQRFGRALFLHGLGGEVEPRAGIGGLRASASRSSFSAAS